MAESSNGHPPSDSEKRAVEKRAITRIVEKRILQRLDQHIRKTEEERRSEEMARVRKALNLDKRNGIENKEQTDPFEDAWKVMSEGNIDAVAAAAAVGQNLELNDSIDPARIEVGVLDAKKEQYCLVLAMNYKKNEPSLLDSSKKVLVRNSQGGFIVYASDIQHVTDEQRQKELREIARKKTFDATKRQEREEKKASKYRESVGLDETAFGEMPEEREEYETTLRADIEKAKKIREDLGLSEAALGELPDEVVRDKAMQN